MFNSLRAKIILIITGILLVALIIVTYFSQRATNSALSKAYYENARNMIGTVSLNVENQHQSIVFYKEKSLEKRKDELKNIVNISIEIIKYYNEKFKKGEISEAKAKQNAIDALRKIRYDNEVGYVFINDLSKPIPKLIMHPTQPELENIVLDEPQYYDLLYY